MIWIDFKIFFEPRDETTYEKFFRVMVFPNQAIVERGSNDEEDLEKERIHLLPTSSPCYLYLVLKEVSMFHNF